MRRLVNKLTGGDMWVSEDRVDEYLAAGHRLAAVPSPKKVEVPVMNPPEAKEETKKQEPVKKVAVKNRKR